MPDSRLPFKVRATDVLHRSLVLGLVGFSVIGLGSITFNIWANSDYSWLNKKKQVYVQEETEESK